ncbi:MAG: anaerobic ribonucleoside-triphosphate reductase activating protein [Bacilli bacterium]
MEISGLQKLTLLDYPGELACTIFTRGCNFTCPFCHNSSLVLLNEKRAGLIPTKEILDFLKNRRGKIDGVCITGGEPLVQADLKDFIKDVRSLGYKVKLDTNGYSPDKLKELIDEDLLDYVAMDIKNSFSKYPETVGRKTIDIERIKRSIDIIKNSGIDYEFRTTAIKEYLTVNDFREIAKVLKGTKRYFIQNFIDSGSVIKSGLHGFDKATLLLFKSEVNSAGVECELRGV